MKQAIILAAAAIAIGAAAPAVAADLPARPYAKAPAMIPSPIYDWSGFYIGINGGGGFAHKCWDLLTGVTGPEGCHDPSGGAFGGQVGYRWQMSNWVFGLEAQGDWADLRGDNISQVIPANRNQTRVDAFGLFTGQIGYAWNNALFYVNGGAAVVDDRYRVFSVATGNLLDTASENRWGAALGVGFEYGFAPNWSFGFQYDHLFMGSNDVSFTNAVGGFGGTDHIRQDVDLFLVRLDYKFGGAGPVVARY